MNVFYCLTRSPVRGISANERRTNISQLSEFDVVGLPGFGKPEFHVMKLTTGLVEMQLQLVEFAITGP